MRFLIVAAILAYAAAAPEPAPPVNQRLEPTPPTISAGDINGAAIEAQVEVADNVRAAIDADRQVVDQVAELQGQAINNAEEQAWRVVDDVKTVEARLDGAAAGAASIIAKNIVRGVATPGVPYANPAVPYANPGAYVAPVVQPAASVPAIRYANRAYAAPIVQRAASVPAIRYANRAYTAPIVQRAIAPVAPAVQATSPVASIVPAPASYAAAPVAPAVQAAPVDAVVETSAPVMYAATPVEYPSVYGYPGYTGYPGYSGYPGAYFESNPYIGNGLDQGLYGSPLDYANFY